MNVFNDGDLREVSFELSKLYLNFDGSEPFYDSVEDVVDETLIQMWLNFDEDKKRGTSSKQSSSFAASRSRQITHKPKSKPC